MRESNEDPKAYWKACLHGDRPEAWVDEPQAGFYQRRLVKGGPYVPVHIWIEESRDEAGDLIDDVKVLCSVDGREASAEDNWSYCCDQAITEARFDYLTSLSTYAKAHDPREPLARPRKKINPLKFPLPTFAPKPKRKTKP